MLDHTAVSLINLMDNPVLMATTKYIQSKEGHNHSIPLPGQHTRKRSPDPVLLPARDYTDRLRMNRMLRVAPGKHLTGANGCQLSRCNRIGNGICSFMD